MTDLSLGWQILGAGVLGATIFLAILFLIVEWPWITQTAITAGWWLVTIWRNLFTDELAKDDQHVPVHRDADEILIAVRKAEIFDLATRRKQLDAIVTYRRTH